jgi:putative sigma-54 modulation protein
MNRMMITGRHVDVTPALRQYVESRIRRLDRFHVNIGSVQVILGVEKYRHKAEIVLHLDRTILQSEALTDEMYGSIDRLFDKISAQLRKRKEKKSSHKGGTRPRGLRGLRLAETPSEPLVKTVRRKVDTLSLAEALDRLAEQADGSFVFQNAETRRIQILQRGPSGQVELLDPLPTASRTG